MTTTLLRNGRVIDPANQRDEIADLLLVDGPQSFEFSSLRVNKKQGVLGTQDSL
jgi:predicted amidohydrolase